MSPTGKRVDEGAQELSLFRVGERLRQRREQGGLSIAQVAEETRIPIRHLQSIENSDYSAIPGPTYAIGFVRAYARAMALDAEQMVNDLRTELGRAPRQTQVERTRALPVDSARVPPRALAWGALAVAILIVAAYLSWRTLSPVGDSAAPVSGSEPAVRGTGGPPQPPPRAAAGAPVTLTATEPVWLRITTRAGETLKQGELKAGESYTVPPDATGPLLLTGRPDVLKVTVGNRAIPPLGTADQPAKDLPLDAASLIARANAPGAAARPAAPPAGQPAPVRSAGAAPGG